MTATVKSTNPLAGSVTFYDQTMLLPVAAYVNLVNGTAQAQMLGNAFGPGTHTINAQYYGDTNNKPSQSGNLNIVVTGSITMYVVAQTGPATNPDTHTVPLNVTIQ